MAGIGRTGRGRAIAAGSDIDEALLQFWDVGAQKPAAAQGSPSGDTLDVGGRIRTLRKQRGWTLDVASERFEIGRSTLAKVETGQMSPTIGLLQKIARGFEVEISTLLKVDINSPTTGRLTITRANQGERHETTEHVQELLCSGLANKRMLQFRSRIKARKNQKLPPWYRHNAEEFIFVLDGCVALHSECYVPTRLKAGDSVYLDGRMGHCLVAEGDEDATVLFIIAE